MSQGQTKQIINKATSAVSQAQKEYSQAPGVGTVNIAELKRKLTEIVDGYSKAYSKIMNEMDITGPSKNQKKKFIKQYLKENLNQNLITSCKRTKAENLDKEFSKEILQILKENFSKPFFVCAETGEPPKKQQGPKPKSLIQRTKQVGRKVSSGVSSGFNKLGTMIPKKKTVSQTDSQKPVSGTDSSQTAVIQTGPKKQTMKQKLKRNLSSAGASFTGAVGGLFKKKDKPQSQGKPKKNQQSMTTKALRTTKQMGRKVSQKVSSGLSKMGSMIPKKEVCNEQEALMLIRLLQANTKNQLANFKFKDGEKKIALQGLQKRIADSDAQIKEMYENIRTAIQAKQQQKKQV